MQNIRDKFLKYFQSKQHTICQTAPLVPEDNSLLFVNAGMVPFKDVFTSKIPSSYHRATSCQMCVRAGGKHNDLENVGYTRRHHTFFEMLGNFAFSSADNGGYFKKEAIEYAFEFIVEHLKFPKEKLWATVHQDDEESYQIWLSYLPKEKIKKLSDKDNFWQMGDTGPCGPCSEIFYDKGEEFDGDEDYIGGDGDRFLEIWNLVFMQYEKDEMGNVKNLKNPCIDTGMGLERVVALSEGVKSNFDSSIFMPLINKIADITDTPYVYETCASHRVIADHIRSAVFLIADGVLFEKDGRGYVLRRILRRAIRYGYLLGKRDAFLYELVDVVFDAFLGVYSHLDGKKDYIKEHIKTEEQRFFQTISHGMNLFNEELKNTKDVFSGEVAFKLYDTYGFPLDLTQDMLREKNISLDVEKYDFCMNEQKQKAKASWKGSGDSVNNVSFKEIISEFGLNEFTGYESVKSQSEILCFFDDEFNKIENVSAGFTGWVLLKQTIFYAQSGGQAGDSGSITDSENIINVLDTQNYNNLNLSKIEVIKGNFSIGTKALAFANKRDERNKHHSATHLLQSALKQVLGDTVSQAGSSNDDTRLRFDFTYSKAISKDELSKIQDIVNEMISKSIARKTEVLSIEDARKTGAVAMFGEKYGQTVRVVSFDDDSIEFCGGTHVQNTAQIGSFYITKESSVSSGVRRIEAVCGKSAIEFATSKISELNTVKTTIKNNDIISFIESLKNQISTLKQELKQSSVSNDSLDVKMISDIAVCVCKSTSDIKSIIDEHKKKYDKLAIMLFKINDNKVQIACGTKGVNISSREWLNDVSSLIDAKGGGRDDFATGGGKNAQGVDDAIVKALEFIKSNIN